MRSRLAVRPGPQRVGQFPASLGIVAGALETVPAEFEVATPTCEFSG